MKKLILFGFLFTGIVNVKSQDYSKIVGFKIGSLKNGAVELIDSKEGLINQIEQKIGVEPDYFIDINVNKIQDYFSIQFFTKDNAMVSIKLVKNERDDLNINLVACTTTKCYRDAGNCQPQYGNTCSDCPNGDCKTEILIISNEQKNNIEK